MPTETRGSIRFVCRILFILRGLPTNGKRCIPHVLALHKYRVNVNRIEQLATVDVTRFIVSIERNRIGFCYIIYTLK